ncbi:MAG TPA: FHA domain-containing protein [Sedimenticola sp.]|nr:FHA domain-containing protein [Sedimenticola sp.]
MAEENPVLVALTPEAEASIGGERLVLDHFPFRIGRESRIEMVSGMPRLAERRRSGDPNPNNDLYLQDRGRMLNVSRQHLQIERDGDGGYRVLDRGSACGTLVGSNKIGGHDAGGECPLKDGDLLVIGTSESPFVFRFVLQA